MGSLLDAIKDAIEVEVRAGKWNGVAIEGGEDTLINIDIIESEFDLEDSDPENDRYVVKAKGDGTVFSIDGNSGEEEEEIADVLVTATVHVSVGPVKGGVREIEMTVQSIGVALED